MENPPPAYQPGNKRRSRLSQTFSFSLERERTISTYAGNVTPDPASPSFQATRDLANEASHSFESFRESILDFSPNGAYNKAHLDAEAGLTSSDDAGVTSGDEAPLPRAQDEKPKDDPPKDENIVDWEGPHDPNNPRNWRLSIRLAHVIIVSGLTLIVNLASTMFAPGAQHLLEDFGETNQVIGTLAVTLQLLGNGIGPLFLAPLSELYGRSLIYHITSIFFVAFSIGCGRSTNISMFLVFRFIMGCAGSAPQTIGGGTIADVIPQEKRGSAMAIYLMGPMLGPVLGPIMGGFIAESKGWRWTFYVVAIVAGTLTLVGFAFMRETYAPVLLARKARKLRRTTGNQSLRAVTDKGLTGTQLFGRAIVRPIKMLLFSPIVLALALFCAFVFGLIYLLFATFPAVFEERYGFSPAVSGLAYLGLGIGMIAGLVTFSIISDKILKQKAGTKVAKPEYRLPPMMWFCPIIPIGFFWYGWCVETRVHWIAPIIGTSLVGLGSLFVVIPTQIYLVDAFGAGAAASGLAANTVLRSIFGTFLPLAGPYMYAALGFGWGNSLLGFVGLLFIPMPVLFYYKGEAIRKRFPINL